MEYSSRPLVSPFFVFGRFYRGTVDGFDFISLYVLQP